MATTSTNNVSRNADILERYSTMMASLDAVQATYVWIDGCQGLRSKTKTLDFVPKSVAEVPIWAFAVDWFYDPSLQLGIEVRMIPVRLYNDPFAGGHHKLIFCEAITFDEGKPICCNTRFACDEALKRAKIHEPELAIQQEYYLFEGDDRRQPLGWPKDSVPKKDAAYDCGVGANHVIGRDLAETHYRACLAAGVKITGESAGAGLSQWKFEIGPSSALSACDDLWMARYLLHRISEQLSIVVSFDGALYPGTAKGSHVEFSTKTMRSIAGIFEIKSAIEKLRKSHAQYVEKLKFTGYPADVTRRLNKAEDKAEAAFEVTIAHEATVNGLGALQDKRVPSNLDPYIVCELLVKSICLN